MDGKSFIFTSRQACNRLRLASALMLLALFQAPVSLFGQMEECPHPHFLRVDKALPSVIVSLRYAADQNITGTPIYDSSVAWLHRDTIRALGQVIRRLSDEGYRLVIWDAYRPPWAQWRLWKAFPDPKFVADPRSFSRHARGTTVDVTLADKSGNLLEMATDFDVFTPRADHDLSDLEPEIAHRVERLRSAMFAGGFRGVPAEWWHYDLAKWPSYRVVHTARDRSQAPENVPSE